MRYYLFIILTLVLTALLGYGTLMTNRLLRTWTPDRNLLLLPQENALRIVLILAAMGLGVLSGLPATQLGWDWPHVRRDLLCGTAVGVGMAVVFRDSTRRLLGTRGARFYSDRLLAHIIPRNGREFMGVTIAMLSVALMEELLFRSLLLGGLEPLLPRWLLLAATAVLFGALHSPQGLWGMAGAGLAGLLFGLLFFWGGTLLLPWTAHYVTNMVQIIMAKQVGAPRDQAMKNSSVTDSSTGDEAGNSS
ncbi:MAG: CPBP family intramembrane metalloprotease [Caldilineaceae bacterium]|nr:CPBP family intramembrane metalloprotease [Caldilineaceae bacterium]